MTPRSPKHLDAIREAVTTETLVTVTFRNPLDPEIPYRQITIRPVELKGVRHLQFSYLTQKQDHTKNYQGQEALTQLEQVLAWTFRSIKFQSTTTAWTAQTAPNGKVILHRDKESATPAQPNLSHDREKALPLPDARPDPFLQAVGIMTSDGRVRPEMRYKFAQINEFLKLLEHTGELPAFAKLGRPVELLDCGCGSAYLSFAAYHYLNHTHEIPARLTGIDTNGELIELDNANALKLDYEGVCFKQTPISHYQPDSPPDILLALHACDTATDDSLALGIRHGAKLMLCAPCCHHNLRDQLNAQPTPDLFDPLTRHGIMKQRLSELLTDSFRAALLRVMGYRTEIIEFVSPEHTDKNLMIRALYRPGHRADQLAAWADYQALKTYWGVTPYLETLLGDALTAQISS